MSTQSDTPQVLTAPAADNTTAPVVPKPERRIVVEDNGPLSHLFDTARFEHMFRIAGAMARASLIPDHFKGKKINGNWEWYKFEEIQANCFLVVNQAIRWGMDPFAVAPETYEVGGKLAYQGKLAAGVINARAGLEGRLRYDFSGTKGSTDFTITVSGKFPGEDVKSISLSVGDAQTDNKMWKKDPEQKLVYSGAIKWARRYCPEVVLGIVTDDDIDRINESALTAEKDANAKVVDRPQYNTEALPEPPKPRRSRKEVPPPAPQELPLPTNTNPDSTAPDPEQPKFVPKTPQDSLAIVLADASAGEGAFIAVLRKYDPKSIGTAQLIKELPDDVCNRVLNSAELSDLIQEALS